MPRPAAPLLRAAPAPIAPAPRVFMLVLLASSLVATAVRAEPMGALALSGGITVRGTTSVDAAALATPLAADDDLLLLSRPQGNRKLFLSALARKATLALERAGFATPKVVASIEPTGEGERGTDRRRRRGGAEGRRGGGRGARFPRRSRRRAEALAAG